MTETDLKELQIDVLNQKIEKIGDEVKKHEKSSKISNAFCIIFLILMAFSVSNFINALQDISFLTEPTEIKQSYSPFGNSTNGAIYLIEDGDDSYLYLSSEVKESLIASHSIQLSFWIGLAVISLPVFAALKSAANNEAKKAKEKRSELDALESKLNALRLQ